MMKKEGNTSNRRKAMNDESLSEKVILFSRFLRNHGFKIFSSNTTDLLRGLEEIDTTVRRDFYTTVRANLVTNEEEWRQFDDLFEAFWQETGEKTGEGGDKQEEGPERACDPDEDLFSEMTGDQTTAWQETAEQEKETLEGRSYSPVSLLEKKDFCSFEKGDMRFARLILKNMMSPFRTMNSRRHKRSRKPGNIDFRMIIRRGLKTGSIPPELFYKRRKKKLKRLVVLADVSGSMDRYARFIMPFILGLKGVGPKTDVFVFSTSLASITPIVRRFDIDKALEIIAREIPEWSGGTRIGFSLHQFNQQYGDRLVNHRTVVVILSDGWDLGGKELLKREMETLNRKAYAIIWLNPLSGDLDYRPICKGMQTAMPFVDYFLPADSLESLKRVGRVLSGIMVQG